MECKEAVYSNDYYDFIMEYALKGRKHQRPVGPCVQHLDTVYDAVYLPREGNPELDIQNYSYTSIPKCYAPLNKSALEASGVLRIQNQPTLSLKGQGVLIGFVDTGERVAGMRGVSHQAVGRPSVRLTGAERAAGMRGVSH